MTRNALALALAITAAACGSPKGGATAPAKPVSADAWAVVNGTEITREEVEKAYRRAAPAAEPKTSSSTGTPEESSGGSDSAPQTGVLGCS